jgi:trimeric autotransporter adhesin
LSGVNVVFTATVYTTVTNTVGPTGTVSFYDTFNNSIVQLGGPGGAITLTPNGPNQSIARFTTTGLLAGTHSIYAIYNGDANFGTATSSTLPLTITDYNVTMIPQTLTLKAGQTGQVVMLLGLVGGFHGTVSFGCTPPSGAETTCGFNQTTLQGGGTTTMVITTTAPRAKPTQQAHDGRGAGRWSAGAASALAVLFCFALPRRRRALPLLMTSLLALSLFPSLGCGLGSSVTTDPTTTTDPGTPLGSQSFTITTAGSDGINTSRHVYQYQVTVQ